jgi:hypothetical protein
MSGQNYPCKYYSSSRYRAIATVNNNLRALKKYGNQKKINTTSEVCGNLTMGVKN